jgi:hypothetical protein
MAPSSVFSPACDATTNRRNGAIRRALGVELLTAALILGIVLPAEAKRFTCAGGDSACLIAAITEANANGKRNTIVLSPGIYTLTAGGFTFGGDDGGLPLVTSTLTISGESALNTVIERSNSAAPFRILTVTTGDLTLRNVTLRGGGGSATDTSAIVRGGGILSLGRLTVDNSVIRDCRAREGGGLNAFGTATIVHSTITGNTAGVQGGGVMVSGQVDVSDSTIGSNSALFGGGFDVSATLTVSASTLTRNTAVRGSAIHVGPPPDAPIPPGTVFGGSAAIASSTIVANSVTSRVFNGAALNTDFRGPTISVKSTIVAGNTNVSPSPSADCPASGESLGFNLIGDASSCAAFLLANDLQGDPLLAPFSDDGTPGHGYYPLTSGSPAIDAGGIPPESSATPKTSHPASEHTDCPARDQIGQPRVGQCDIGAIEFHPDRVSIHRAQFDPRSGVLLVSAGSSGSRDDVSLAVSVEGCVAAAPMLRVDRSYYLLSQLACDSLEGATVTVTSSGGGSASTEIR